jgi:hypothetical protein
MTDFTYEHLDAAQVEQAQAAAVAPADPVLDYASLLPAWEADHVAHVALLAKAQADGDEAAVMSHQSAIETLEKAILDGRTKVTPSA